MQELKLVENLEESSQRLNQLIGARTPEIAIVLGSGLGPLADRIEDAVKIPFADVPPMQTSTATSHVGQFVCGVLSGKQVICMQGRLHGYEGYTPQQVAYPIWLMNRIGCKVLITTNAAGAINEGYKPGDFCIMKDHINFTGRNPLAGLEPDRLAPRFVSMYEAYDPHLRGIARDVAATFGINAHEGVYLGLLGPSFETPAEISAFREWGADTVAMSVCEEVIAARHAGMKVLGISLCSNMACGIQASNPDDAEVFEVAKRAETSFCRLIEETVKLI